MNREDERRILHEICRNSKMGVQAIEKIMGRVYDEELAYELHAEAGKMREFEQRAAERLKDYGDDAANIKPGVRAMLKRAIRMKTMFSDRKEHVADMMQKGNQRGADELKKAIHKYKNGGIYATELAKDMIDFEEGNLKRLEPYKKD